MRARPDGSRSAVKRAAQRAASSLVREPLRVRARAGERAEHQGRHLGPGHRPLRTGGPAAVREAQPPQRPDQLRGVQPAVLHAEFEHQVQSVRGAGGRGPHRLGLKGVRPAGEEAAVGVVDDRQFRVQRPVRRGGERRERAGGVGGARPRGSRGARRGGR
ncbi:hypothetical protein, partial [Streptomyces aurantiacus]|uniref:hypothetical protein n=1 Tax=Streptomyces aurantiacus TaxID=47760 RepID=UPI001939A7BD